MSEAKFTKGPWNQESTGDGKRICIGLGMFDGPNGYDVAEVYSDDVTEETCVEAQANAHLIAAAPELYEALDGLIGVTDRPSAPDYVRDAIRAAHAALAKARGEA